MDFSFPDDNSRTIQDKGLDIQKKKIGYLSAGNQGLRLVIGDLDLLSEVT